MGMTACLAAERDSLTQQETEVPWSKLVLFVLSEAVLLMSEYTVTLTSVNYASVRKTDLLHFQYVHIN